MKRFARLAIVLIGAALLTIGCKKKSDLPPPPAASAFDSAPTDIKEMWTRAIEADRTNDFYGAEVLLYELTRRDLPPDQIQAAKDQIVLTHTRLKDAVTKGDPQAKASFDQFRMAPPNRPPPGSGQ